MKHIIWRFRICNYFREMFKFRDFMNTLRNFAKSVFARIFEKFKYLAKQFMLRNFQVTCLNIICSYFKSLKFFRTPILEPLRSHFKSRNQNIFEKFKLNRNLQRIPLKMMYNMSMLRHRFSNERWGATLNYLPLLFSKSV